MSELYLTYAEQRRLHGIDSFRQPSRFIREIPDELVEEIRPQIKVSRPVYRQAVPTVAESAGSVKLGQRVRHKKFGDGVVLNCEGSGAHERVQVNFETEGTKWLVMSYANLDLM